MFEFTKTRMYKTIAFFLVIVMFFSVVNLADITTVFAEKAEMAVEEDYEPVPVQELAAEREEDVTVFQNDDGTKSMYISGEPIRVKNEQGQWEDIDNSIVEVDPAEESLLAEEGFAYKNVAGKVDILFSEGLQDQYGLKVENDGYAVTFGALTDEGYTEKRQGRMTPTELQIEEEKQLALQPPTVIEQAPVVSEDVLPEPPATLQPEIQVPVDDAVNGQKKEEDIAAESGPLVEGTQSTAIVGQESTVGEVPGAAGTSPETTPAESESQKEPVQQPAETVQPSPVELQPEEEAPPAFRLEYSSGAELKTAADMLFEEAGALSAEDAKLSNQALEIKKVEEAQDQKATSIAYVDPFGNGADIKVIPTTSGAKEDIILHSKPSSTVFRYFLKLDGLVPVMQDTGAICLYDKQEYTAYLNSTDPKKELPEEKAEIPKPNMCDSSNQDGFYSEDVWQTMERIGGSDEYILTITADPKYFERTDLTYPVVIDPSVTYNTATYIDDWFVTQKYPNNNYRNDKEIKIGNSNDLAISRGYFYFSPSLISKFQGNNACLLLDAEFRLQENYGSATTPVHEIYPSAGAINPNLTWNNQPTSWYSTKASFTTRPSAINAVNITPMVAQWISGSMPNYGFVLKQSNESQNYYKRYLSMQSPSGQKPTLILNYFDETYNPNLILSPKGLGATSGKGYFDYTWSHPLSQATMNYIGLSYNLILYNGAAYEQKPITKTIVPGTNAHSTKGLSLWSRYGTDLPNDPRPEYQRNNSPWAADVRYHFRVQPKNKWGNVLGIDNCKQVSAALPDTTAPNMVASFSTSYNHTNGNVTFTWPYASDNPSGMGVGVKEYHIYYEYQLPGSSTYIDRKIKLNIPHKGAVGHTTTVNRNIFLDASNKPLNAANVKFSIHTLDKAGNWSAAKYATTPINLPDNIPPEQPKLTIENVNWSNTNPTISWTGQAGGAITDPSGNLSYLQYSVNNAQGQNILSWRQFTSDMYLDTGSYFKNRAVLDLSSQLDGTYTILLRAVDSIGNISPVSNSVVYKKDATAPVITLKNFSETRTKTIGEVPALEAHIEEQNYLRSEIKCREYDSGQPMTAIPFSNEQIDNEGNFSCDIDTSELENQKTYQFRFIVYDAAGNYSVKEFNALLSKRGEIIEKSIDILNPVADEMDEMGTIYVHDAIQQFAHTIPDGVEEANLQSELYIDGKLVSSGAPDELEENMPREEGGEPVYGEMTNHGFFIKATDATTGQEYYSSSGSKVSMELADFDLLDSGVVADSQNIDLSDGRIRLEDGATQGSIILQPSEEDFYNICAIDLSETVTRPDGTTISYNILTEDGGSAAIEPGVSWSTVTGLNNFAIEITLERDNTALDVNVEKLEFEVLSLSCDYFTVELVGAPSNVATRSEINYSIWVKWAQTERKFGEDTEEPEEPENIEAEEEQDIKYEVYWGMEEDFEADLVSHTNLLGNGTDQLYQYDVRLKDFGETVYYKIYAKKTFGDIERYSVPSEEVNATVVDEAELEKQLGIQSYWAYTTSSAGKGTANINMGSGNLAYQAVDFTTNSGPLLSQVMQRTYNSQSSSETPMGLGWDFSFNTTLLEEYAYDETAPEGEQYQVVAMILKDGDGTIHRFQKNADGTYQTPQGIFLTLTQNEDGLFMVKRADNVEYHFNESMQLVRFSEPNGNALVLEYDSIGFIASVHHNIYGDVIAPDSNQYNQITFLHALNDTVIEDDDDEDPNNDSEYDINNKYQLVEVKNWFKDGRATAIDSYELDYDDQNRLISVKDFQNNNATERYLYGEDNGPAFEIKSPTNQSYMNDTRSHQYFKDVEDRISGVVIDVTSGTKQSLKIQYGQAATGFNNASQTKVTLYNSGNYTNQVAESGYYIDNTNDTLLGVRDGEGNTTKYLNYDSNLRPRTMVDPKGNQTGFTYDNKGNITRVVDAQSNVATMEYHPVFGKLTKSTAPGGVVSQFEYDTKGNLTKQTDPEGNVTNYSYNTLGLTTSAVSKKGANERSRTSYGYDTRGKMTSQTVQMDVNNNSTTSYTYDLRGYPDTVTDARGLVTDHDYNALGQQVCVTYMSGRVETWDYNLNGLPTEYRDLFSYTYDSVATYTYDELGRIIETDVANGFITSVAYSFDGSGNPVVTTTDPAGNTTVQVSDKAGRMKSETVGGILTTTYQYDANGNTTKVTDASGRVSTAEYDTLNRLTATQAGSGAQTLRTSYTYDVYGNRATEKQGTGSSANSASSSTVGYTYDKIGRILTVEQVIDAASPSNKATTTYAYDNYANGMFYDTAVNPEGIQTKTYYNRMGLAVREEVIGKDGITALPVKEYSYDETGNMTQAKTDGTVVNTWEYNNQGFVEYEYVGDSTSMEFTYYQYDLAGHKTSMETRWSAHSAQTQTWAYDGMQRMIQTVLYGNDTVGTEITTAIDHEYDAAGNLVGARYADGNKTAGMTYTYDAAGRISKIIDPQTNKTVQKYEYSLGDLSKTTQYLQFDVAAVGNESGLLMTQDYAYNSAGLQTSVTHKDGAGAVKETYTGTYDYRGYMLTEGIQSYYDGTSTQNKTHSYDNIGQLTRTTETSSMKAAEAAEATAISTTADYTYDKAGNRLSMTQVGSTAVPGQDVEQKNDTYTYTLDNFLRVTSVAKNTQTDHQTYTYDARGNQTQLVERTLTEGSTPAKTETTDYTYDLLNQLISTDKTTTGDDPDAWDPETVNRYNGDGQRVRQEVNGSPERYMYMGSALLYTDDGSNSGKVTQNILDPGGQIVASRREYSDGYVSTGVSNYYFYHYDMRGSVTNIVAARKKTDGEDVSATNPVEIRLVQGYTYDEFGDTAAKKSESSFKNDVKFTGAVQDVTGLYYMQSRHYSPDTGKFLQQDTYEGETDNPKSHNLYTYCYNNPVSYIDPTGHMPQGTGGSGMLPKWGYSYIYQDPKTKKAVYGPKVYSKDFNYGHDGGSISKSTGIGGLTSTFTFVEGIETENPFALTSALTYSNVFKQGTQTKLTGNPNAVFTANTSVTTQRGYFWDTSFGRTTTWGASVSIYGFSLGVSASNSGNVGASISFRTGENTTFASGMTIGTYGIRVVGESKTITGSNTLTDMATQQSFTATTETYSINWWGVAGVLYGSKFAGDIVKWLPAVSGNPAPADNLVY